MCLLGYWDILQIRSASQTLYPDTKETLIKNYIVGGKKMAALFKMLVTEVLVVQPACPNGTCCSYVVAGGGIGSIT